MSKMYRKDNQIFNLDQFYVIRKNIDTEYNKFNISLYANGTSNAFVINYETAEECEREFEMMSYM